MVREIRARISVTFSGETTGSAALVSIYILEFDDAVEAGKLLNDFGTVWESASVGRKNRLLKSMLQAIYVDLDKREVIGLLPKKTLMAPIMAMADRCDIAVMDATREYVSRNGGDGGGRAPRFPSIPVLVEFRDAPDNESRRNSWIRDKRLATGLSQRELADSLGVHEKTVQSWEKGESSPRPYNRQLLEIQLVGHPIDLTQ